MNESYAPPYCFHLFPLVGKNPTAGISWKSLVHSQSITATTNAAVNHAISANCKDGVNIGMAIPRGCLVLDADSPEAIAAVERWLRAVGVDPIDVQQTLKGAHFLIAYSGADLEQSPIYCVDTGARIDLRVAGKGYIAVEPSIHPDSGEHDYEWRGDGPENWGQPQEYDQLLADPRKADRFFRLTAQPTPEGKLEPSPNVELSGKTRVADISTTWPEGERNERLFRYARKVAGTCESAEQLVSMLEFPNREHTGGNPLPAAEVEQIARSAWAYRMREGKPLPVISTEEGEGAADPGTLMADVEEGLPFEWLWPQMIPLGALTDVNGAGGIGKSLISLDLAARLSKGSPWPDGTPSPGPAGTVLISSEDDLARTVRPRLEAAGADMSRILDVRYPDLISIDQVSVIELCIKKVGAKLVVIDPLMDYVGRTDMHRDNEVRAMLHALVEVAHRLRVSVVTMRHISKGAGSGSAANAGVGSVAMTNVARCQLLVTPHPEEAGAGRLSLSKSNVSRPEMRHRTLEFRIHTDWHREDTPSLQWDPNPLQMTADEAMQEAYSGARNRAVSGSGRGRPPEARVAAEEWIREQLADGQAVRSAAFYSRAEGAGHSPITTRRALKSLGVTSERRGGAWWLIPPWDTWEDPTALT